MGDVFGRTRDIRDGIQPSQSRRSPPHCLPMRHVPLSEHPGSRSSTPKTPRQKSHAMHSQGFIGRILGFSPWNSGRTLEGIQNIHAHLGRAGNRPAFQKSPSGTLPSRGLGWNVTRGSDATTLFPSWTELHYGTMGNVPEDSILHVKCNSHLPHGFWTRVYDRRSEDFPLHSKPYKSYMVSKLRQRLQE